MKYVVWKTNEGIQIGIKLIAVKHSNCVCDSVLQAFAFSALWITIAARPEPPVNSYLPANDNSGGQDTNGLLPPLSGGADNSYLPPAAGSQPDGYSGSYSGQTPSDSYGPPSAQGNDYSSGGNNPGGYAAGGSGSSGSAPGYDGAGQGGLDNSYGAPSGDGSQSSSGGNDGNTVITVFFNSVARIKQ